jgi:ParB-like chromosome segregation protein Spo0J
MATQQSKIHTNGQSPHQGGSNSAEKGKITIAENALVLPAMGAIAEKTLLLAPGVDIKKPETWRTKSHWTANDYKPGEGIFDWSRPNEPQPVRVYLLVPNKNQTRDFASPSELAQTILSMAEYRKNLEDIWVRRGEGDELHVHSGHRRLRAAINAGLKFLIVKESPQLSVLDGYSEESSSLRAMIEGNKREELSLKARVSEARRYIEVRTKDLGKESLTLAEQKALLISELKMTSKAASETVILFNLNPSVFALVQRKNLSVDDAVVLATKEPDQKRQKVIVDSYLQGGKKPFQAVVNQITGGKSHTNPNKPELKTREYQSVMLPGRDQAVKIEITSVADLTEPEIGAALLEAARKWGIVV